MTTITKHVWVMRQWADDPEPIRVGLSDGETVAAALRARDIEVPEKFFVTTADGRQFPGNEVTGHQLRDGAIVRISQMEMVPGGGRLPNV